MPKVWNICRTIASDASAQGIRREDLQNWFLRNQGSAGCPKGNTRAINFQILTRTRKNTDKSDNPIIVKSVGTKVLLPTWAKGSSWARERVRPLKRHGCFFHGSNDAVKNIGFNQGFGSGRGMGYAYAQPCLAAILRRLHGWTSHRS